MAVIQSSVGLKKVEIADVPATGLPTTWTELKATEIGSATLSESANTTENIKIEQSPSGTYRTLITEYGVKTFVIRLYDVTADNLNKLKGGTVVPGGAGKGKTWKAPREAVSKNQAVRLTTFDDYKIILPNGFLEALIDWPMTVGALGGVALTITAQLPADTSLSDIEVEEPVSTE